MAGRAPTGPELDALLAAVHDHDLRGRGRLTCVRIAVPSVLDADVVRALLKDRMDGEHGLAGCEVVVRDGSQLRVLGGFFR